MNWPDYANEQFCAEIPGQPLAERLDFARRILQSYGLLTPTENAALQERLHERFGVRYTIDPQTP